MLKLLRLRNFQKHKKLTIKFSPQITTIVGPSDQGKSAILRALHWLAFNRPAGDAFRTHGTPETVAQLITDKHTITRRKGKGVNTYSLDKKKLKAFGSDPPEPIVNALQLQAFNFQLQHDSPFWLTLSAGEVAKRLNSVVDLTIIDESVKRARSAVRSLEAEERVVVTRVRGLEDRTSRLDWVEDAHANAAETRKLEYAISRESMRRAEAADVLTQLQALQPLVGALSGCAGAFAKVVKQRETLHELSLRQNRLETLLLDVSQAFALRREAREQLEQQQTKLNELLKGRCPVCQRKMQ